jgi:hypothetical protein
MILRRTLKDERCMRSKGSWYGMLKDENYFRRVSTDGFTVVWPEGQDIQSPLPIKISVAGGLTTTVKIPANFNFRPFINADGKMNIHEVLWAIILSRK